MKRSKSGTIGPPPGSSSKFHIDSPSSEGQCERGVNGAVREGERGVNDCTLGPDLNSELSRVYCYDCTCTQMKHLKMKVFMESSNVTVLYIVSVFCIAGSGIGALPGPVLGGSRMRPSGSVDDTYIANIIWDSSPFHPSHDPPSSSSSSSLQKSPLHKSTSALTDLQEGGVIPMTMNPSVNTGSNRQGQPHLMPHNSRSHTSEYYSSCRHHDDLDGFPTPPTPRTAGVVQQGSGSARLPEFNLADEIFQHFSRPVREVTPPPTSARPSYVSPRQTTPGSELRTHHFPLPPHTSSPIKRASSPDIGGHLHGNDLRGRSSSPDMFLPTPEHHHHQNYRQQPVSHSYSNSYHSTTPGRNAHSNPPSRSNSKPNFRPGTTGAAPTQSVPSPHWHDGMGHQHQTPSPNTKHHPNNDMTTLREEGGAYHQGQQQKQPPRSPAVLSPRRRNEDSVEIQEFLQDLAQSKTNPFGEGTLV